MQFSLAGNLLSTKFLQPSYQRTSPHVAQVNSVNIWKHPPLGFALRFAAGYLCAYKCEQWRTMRCEEYLRFFSPSFQTRDLNPIVNASSQFADKAHKPDTNLMEHSVSLKTTCSTASHEIYHIL